MIADPRAVIERWPAPRMRLLAELAALVTETPWCLTRAHRERAHAVGVSDEEMLHAVALSAFFGHLNRIADAVAVPLDYTVRHTPPHAEPATPPLHRAPHVVHGAPAIELALRPTTAQALAAWSAYVATPRAPLDEDQRSRIAAHVGRLVGDAARGAAGELDRDLAELAETVTLAPWRLGDAAYAPLRARGFDDAALFDACVVASSAGVHARIAVALVGLGRQGS